MTGFKRLAGERVDQSVRLAFCWVHMRRAFFQFHASTKSPPAAEVLLLVAALYAIEAEIRRANLPERQRVRQDRSRPLVEELHDWLRIHIFNCTSGASDLAKAMRYAIRHWPGLVAFWTMAKMRWTQNTVERTHQAAYVDAQEFTFLAGSDGGARHWSIVR